MKKTVLLIVLLFGLHHVISDGTIGIGVFTASAQQMANEFDEYDDGNNGGEGSSINGGELPNTDVWGHQPDNYNDIWGTISAIQDWLDNLNNPNNSEMASPLLVKIMEEAEEEVPQKRIGTLDYTLRQKRII